MVVPPRASSLYKQWGLEGERWGGMEGGVQGCYTTKGDTCKGIDGDAIQSLNNMMGKAWGRGV